jgi:hypothetical protein
VTRSLALSSSGLPFARVATSCGMASHFIALEIRPPTSPVSRVIRR